MGFLVLASIKFLRDKYELDVTSKNKKSIENDKKNKHERKQAAKQILDIKKIIKNEQNIKLIRRHKILIIQLNLWKKPNKFEIKRIAQTKNKRRRS